MWQGCRVTVTGAAGFIGSHLVKRLVKLGAQVRAVDNLERGKLDYLEDVLPQITFIIGDVRHPDVCKSITQDADVVFHLASKVGGIGYYLSKPGEVISECMAMDTNMLQASLANQVKHFFYASSAHVYPKELQTLADSPLIREDEAFPANPELSYGWAKLAMEQQLLAHHKQCISMEISIARFIGIYGENQDIGLATGSVIPVFTHRAIKYPTQGPFTVWGTGEETRSYCFIDDAIDCMILMVEAGKKNSLVGPLNVGKQERNTISEIAEKVIQLSRKDIQVSYDRSKATVIWGQWCDCSLAKSVLGWEAKTSLEKGLERVYAYVEERLSKMS